MPRKKKKVPGRKPKIVPPAKGRYRVHTDNSANLKNAKRRPRGSPYKYHPPNPTALTLARQQWIRERLAEALTVEQIVNIAEKQGLFEFPSARKGGAVRIPARATIRRLIWRTQSLMREEVFNGAEEVRKSYDRLLLAFRKGLKNGDARGMTVAIKEINRMLGLKMDLSGGSSNEAERIMEQLRQMQALTTGGSG